MVISGPNTDKTQMMKLPKRFLESDKKVSGNDETFSRL